MQCTKVNDRVILPYFPDLDFLWFVFFNNVLLNAIETDLTLFLWQQMANIDINDINGQQIVSK